MKKPINISIYFIVISILLMGISFFIPSRLFEIDMETNVQLMRNNFWGYISIYSLILFPFIIGFYFTKFKRFTFIISSLFVILHIGLDYEIRRIILFELDIIEFIIHLIGFAAIILTFIILKKIELNRNYKIGLFILSSFYIAMNLFLSLIGMEFNWLILIIIAYLILILCSNLISNKYLKIGLILLSIIQLYIMTLRLNCNVEFISDMGFENWSIVNLINCCGTFYFWLLSGLILNFLSYLGIKNESKTN